MVFTIKVNGATHRVDVDGDTPLLWVLRDVLGMTGTKFGCGKALCGACTVHVGGVPTRSCIAPVDSIGSSEVTTIEAVGATPAGAAIQRAWLEREVVQCGYCQSGQVMSAVALLANTPHPNDSDIDNAMSGNICRCGTYPRIRDAIKHAANRTGRSRTAKRANNDPQSRHFPDRRRGSVVIRKLPLPAQVPAGQHVRGRRADAECEPAVHE